MRGKSVRGIKQDSYKYQNTVSGREPFNLVRVVSLTTGFSFRGDVG